jgi:hypothetical protein
VAVVVLGDVPLMGVKEKPAENRWTIHAVEKLLGSLTGVLSVRLVAKPGSDIEEIHLLTTEEVSPKQTVRNVESALLAHFDLEVDHRKISVAQTNNPPASRTPDAPQTSGAPLRPVVRPLTTSAESRILFLGHQVETQRSQRVRMVVSVEWQGQHFQGEASGPDVARGRLDAIAHATLGAVQSAMTATEDTPDFTLTLDGVKILNAFDRDYVLVSVHALSGRQVTHLSGTAQVDDTPDKAVIMASLQATDRWVRGRM